MYKKILFLAAIIILNQCSLDTKTGLWTEKQVIEKKEENLEEVFKTQEIIEKEFNSNLKIKITSPYKQKPFINNLTNNTGYINFDSELNYL